MNIHDVGVHTARPAEGGCTRGVSAERFETPLVGRAACFWRRGGNPPAPAFPRRGETGKGAIKPPCCRRHLLAHYARIPPAYALPASPYGHSKARIPANLAPVPIKGL